MSERTQNAADSEVKAEDEGLRLHIGLAEQGKLYALGGDHKRALLYYRRAIRMSVQRGDPEIFFRHYLECVMESLERMAQYDDVVAYCDKGIEFYAQHPPPHELAVRDLASIHQRRGMVLLKQGKRSEAHESLRQAKVVVTKCNQRLPLCETLLRWLDASLQLDAQRITAEQERGQYFSVRRDTVIPHRAIRVADERMLGTPLG